MSSIILKNIADNDIEKNVLEEINNEAFPQHERLPLPLMERFARETDTDILGVFTENKMIGFAFLIKNGSVGYLNYFAIKKEYRGRGYGRQALALIIERYPDYHLILDFEPPEEAPENMQRKRRKNFYLDCGFKESGKYSMFNGHYYELVYTGDSFDIEGFIELARVIGRYRPDFPAVVYDRIE